jgi:hypothetical protein
LQYNYEVKLRDEKLARTTVNDENVTMKVKYVEHLTEIEDCKKEFAKTMAEEKKLLAIIHVLEADINGLAEEVFTL